MYNVVVWGRKKGRRERKTCVERRRHNRRLKAPVKFRGSHWPGTSSDTPRPHLSVRAPTVAVHPPARKECQLVSRVTTSRRCVLPELHRSAHSQDQNSGQEQAKARRSTRSIHPATRAPPHKLRVVAYGAHSSCKQMKATTRKSDVPLNS